MKNLLTKYPFLKQVIGFIIGAITTYLGITQELPVNKIETPKVDSVKVVTDTLKVDTLTFE